MTTVNTILLTFDVEEWFQVENLRPWMPFSSWERFESRVEKSTHQILSLLDSAPSPGSIKALDVRPRATFFILGWLAKRLPHLVREIDRRGHEVASHGMDHRMCNQLSESELKDELISSKKLLEDIIGKPVSGYRAPSFSVSNRVLDIIQASGYRYDSSYNNFGMHGRYGRITVENYDVRNSVYRINSNFDEIPVSNLRMFGQILPWAGGGYFRLLPFWLFQKGVRKIIRLKNTYVFYAHPWEFDPDQPVIKQASLFSKLKHYNNLSKTSKRLASMLEVFSDCRFLTCHGYLKEIWGKNEK